MLLIASILTLGVLAIQQDNEIKRMKFAGDLQCDSGYIAKVVEGEKVTCIMHRVSPGTALKKIDKNYLTRSYHADVK